MMVFIKMKSLKSIVSDRAKEIAEDNNLNPDYYDAFVEFYIEECRESDRGYFFGSQKYMIDLWWDHNKDLYETKTPYKKMIEFVPVTRYSRM